MFYIIGSTVEPNHEATWEEIKQSDDRERWVGRACTIPLPGGGNTPNEHSKENNG